MTDDELMDALGETARDRDLDPRWEKLAAGELSDEELAQLRVDAGDEADALEAAFAPLGDDDQAEFVSAILGGEADVVSTEVTPKAAPAPVARPSGAGARSGSRRAFLVGATAVALAAAIALFVWLPQTTPTLPEYASSIHGGAQTKRGTSDAPDARFRADDRIELRLRPSTETSIPVHAAVFRASGSGAPERLNVPIEVAASGAVRLSALASELLPQPGEYTVTIVVAPSWAPIDDLQMTHAVRVPFTLVREDGQ